MRRGARPLALDFVAPVHRAPVLGWTLLALGLGAALSLGVASARLFAERGRLDAALGALAPARHRTADPEALKLAAEAATVESELAVPWTRLLAELESASRDSASRVSLLAVEPEPTKGTVQITAEVRQLNDALGYVRRLEKSEVLRHPMLESHERRRDDREHPLRVRLSAEWRP